jgi:glycerophosphoryl diester phosphodiesterase
VRAFFAKPMRIGAHRGGAEVWPEDTVEAYRRAAETWPDVLLEGDAHVTSDGQVVLLHDDSVDRTTNGTGGASNMTLAELKALDAGYRFTRDDGQTFPYRGKGVTIPTLGEALAASPDSRFLIELKNQKEAPDAVTKVLREADALERVIVASFNPALMSRAQHIEPKLLRCYDFVEGATLLSRLRGAAWADYTPAADMLAVDDDILAELKITPDELHAIQAKGISVLVHTINREEQMREFLALGVDCILTDRPNVLASLIAAKA